MVFLILSLLVSLNLCGIRQIQFISRHCDRTPLVFFDFPNAPYEHLKIQTGHLTNLGLHHCYELGKRIRSEYIGMKSAIDPISTLSEKYNSNDYLFKSSSKDRAIRSGYAASMGIFPQGSKVSPEYHPIDHRSETFYSLPNGTTPIGISVYSSKNDVHIRAYDKCKNVTKKNEDFIESNIFRDYQARQTTLWANVTSHLGYGIGNNPTAPRMDKIIEMHQQFIFMEENGLLQNISMPSELWEAWGKAKDEFFILEATYIYGNYGIGLLFDDIRSKVSDYIDDPSSTEKVIQYSGHDSTLAAALVALKMYDNPINKQLKIQPGFGSAFIIMIRDGPRNTSSHEDVGRHMEFYFLRSFDGDLIQIFLPGVAEPLSVNEFYKYLKNHQGVKDWCDVCQRGMKLSDKSSYCLSDDVHKYKGYNTASEIYMFVLIVLMFAVAGMIILCYILQMISKVGQSKELRELHQSVTEMSESVNSYEEVN